MSCLFGSGSGKESQRAKDDAALIERYRKEISALKQDAARIERELQDVRESSALKLTEKNEIVVAMREEIEDIRGQLERAAEKEEGVAEYTVSLIKEIAELKGKLRGSAGRDEALGKDESTANYEEEIQRLKSQLVEAKDEARGYSEEIGDLAKQITDLQEKSCDAAAYRKEIQHLKMKLGSDESSSPDTSGVADFSADSSFVSGLSVSTHGIEVVPSGSASLSERNTDAKVITTVSLTSGFFGNGANNESVTLSKETPKGTPTRAEKSSLVTPPGTDDGNKPIAAPIDEETVANAVKCVEELIRRVNQTKTMGKISRKELFKKKDPGAKSHIEFVGMPQSMNEIAGANSGVLSAVSFSTAGKKDSDNENSSFYSAASAEAGKAGDFSSLKVAVETKSPSNSTGIVDTSSWKPVGTTGELLLVSDESTINTEDADYDDEVRSCHSAYSAPVSNVKGRNDSAVIVAELYRVQSLLCSVIGSKPNVDRESEQYLSPKEFVRVNNSL